MRREETNGYRLRQHWVALSGAAALLLVLVASGQATAVDFLRGDANGDGGVSISDSHHVLNYLFLGGTEPECMEGVDTNEDTTVNIADSIKILQYLYLGGPAPDAPFPDVGPDPQDKPDEENLPCDSYGNGSPLDDPAALLEVVDVAAPGGADRRAYITLAVSNSTSLAGYACSILDGAGVIEEYDSSTFEPTVFPRSLIGLDDEGGFKWVRVTGGRLDVAVINHLVWPQWIPPGESVPFVEVPVCLRPETVAGDYQFTLESAELVDAESGRAIYPSLADGTLTVLTDVEAEAPCSEPPIPPEDIHILFKLEETTAEAGGEAAVPFVVKSDRGSQGFGFSVDFEEEVLQVTDILMLWERPDGTPYDLAVFEFNNANSNAGSAGLDEGFVVGVAVISLTDSEAVLPPGEEVPVLEFRFAVSAEATGSTELVFEDGGQGTGGPVNNRLIASGRDITPALASSFVFIDGKVNIIPDGSPFRHPFLRADANADGLVNISDPQATLNYLFLGRGEPACHDAADSNDDGELNIADPIATLQVLFLGVGAVPPPFLGCGLDLTEDELACDAFGPCD